MNLNVPFLKDHEIEEQAEHFRQEYFGSALPFNPEIVWDNILGKHFEPKQDLKRYTGVEAALSTNFEIILVDHESLTRRKHPGHLAFSITHEIGHYHLHKDCLSQLNFYSINVWKAYFEAIRPTEYHRMEDQADKFAAYTLMPKKEVIEEATKWLSYLLSESTSKDEYDVTDPGFRRYFASLLAEQFNVSVKAMRIRLMELGFFKDS